MASKNKNPGRKISGRTSAAGKNSLKKSALLRRRRRRLKRTLITAFGLIFAAVAGFAGYRLANSSFFTLEEIRVEGYAALSRDEIAELSGLRTGDNLLKLSRARAEENILTHPFVKEAEVRWILPDKAEIRVSERTPAAVAGGGERYLVLDEGGFCLDEAGPATAESWALPKIRCGGEAMTLLPGEQSEDGGILAALALIARLDPFFLENILEFDAPSAERLAVINRDGLPVYFGPPEDLERKLHNYEELLIKDAGQYNAETLNYVDLRYDTQVTLNWKTGAE